MKRFILAAAMLLAAHLGALATTVTNTTSCPIQVKQICYNAACGILSINIYPVSPGGSLIISPACPTGMMTVYEVCWTAPPCAGTCTTVEGSAWRGCGPGTYTNTLPPCFPCSPTGGTVTYDPILDTLDITP